MNALEMMNVGAKTLADMGSEHTAKHAAIGFSKTEWDLLCQDEMWTPTDRRQVRAILAEAVNATLTAAGLPAVPLPAQYVACVIVQLVAPCNRLVAATRAPETYDAVQASGLSGPVVIEMVDPKTMVSLVMAYTSQVVVDPDSGREVFQDKERLLQQAAEK